MSRCPACGYDARRGVARTWEMLIPHQPPTQNAFKGQDRFTYQKLRKRWRDWLFVEARRLGIPVARTLRRLWVTRLIQHRGRAFDYGNLVGGCKPILDAMATARRGIGIIHDDASKWCEQYYAQRRDPDGRAGLLLRVEELY